MTIKEKIINQIERNLATTSQGTEFTISGHKWMGRKLSLGAKCKRIIAIMGMALATLLIIPGVVLAATNQYRHFFKWIMELQSGFAILGKVERVASCFAAVRLAENADEPSTSIILNADTEKLIFKFLDTTSLARLAVTSSQFLKHEGLNAELASMPPHPDCNVWLIEKFLKPALRAKESLLTLDLSANRFQWIITTIDDIYIKKIVEECPNLLSINLSGINITRGMLQNLSRLRNLTDLFISRCPTMRNAYVRDIPRSVRLLDIRGCGTRDEPLTGDSNIDLPPDLRHLIHGGYDFRSEHVRLLPRSLVKLELYGSTKLTDESARDLPPALQSLKIFGSFDITPHFFEILNQNRPVKLPNESCKIAYGVPGIPADW